MNGKIGFALAQATVAAAMLGVVAAISVALDQPILIPSLAAATFTQILAPSSGAARPWPIGAGQVCGLLCGLGAVFLTNATSLPSFASEHPLGAARAMAVVLACCATLLVQRAVRAGNAPGAALAATIALGDEVATMAGVARMVAGIALILALGQAGRVLLLRVATSTD